MLRCSDCPLDLLPILLLDLLHLLEVDAKVAKCMGRRRTEAAF